MSTFVWKYQDNVSCAARWRKSGGILVQLCQSGILLTSRDVTHLKSQKMIYFLALSRRISTSFWIIENQFLRRALGVVSLEDYGLKCCLPSLFRIFATSQSCGQSGVKWKFVGIFRIGVLKILSLTSFVKFLLLEVATSGVSSSCCPLGPGI